MGEVLTTSSEETMAWGARLGALLQPGDLVCLYGEIGSGKTTLTKGIVQGVGGIAKEAVTSPTFTLLHIYQGRFPVYHFDLFRIGSLEELEEIGYREYFQGDGICIVEWTEKGEEILPLERLDIFLSFGEREEERKIILKPQGERFRHLCRQLGGKG
ncbi:MAG: tRNA (adenosine(37)-N6)-threonylcarbamoyltransferase complex ATPase subunit type 1 TsaE [Nitrospinota bacterium]|nr:MAG: tRNA (adenosine(37)-N6)-threonylcarbamoyltransferase complex ATPase subunit type 1 TsaE [Nitrospinota bacterium]